MNTDYRTNAEETKLKHRNYLLSADGELMSDIWEWNEDVIRKIARVRVRGG